MLPALGIALWTACAAAAPTQSVAVWAVTPAPDFDEYIAAKLLTDLQQALRGNSDNHVADATAPNPTLVADVGRGASLSGARFIFTSDISNDLDTVIFEWALYDVLLDASVGKGTMMADIDNMVPFPLEIAAQVNQFMRLPVSYTDLCGAGVKRLDRIAAPAVAPATAERDRARMALAAQQFGDCLASLDAAFTALTLTGGYLAAAPR